MLWLIIRVYFILTHLVHAKNDISQVPKEAKNQYFQKLENIKEQNPSPFPLKRPKEASQ